MAITDTEWWREHRYLAGKEIDGGLWVVLAPMLFTTRLMICDEGSIYEFWCYEDPVRALLAFADFEGTGTPLNGWTRHHSARS